MERPYKRVEVVRRTGRGFQHGKEWWWIRIRLAKGINADINTSSGNVVWHTLEGAKRAACKISDELGGWPVYYRKALLKGKPK